MSLEHVSNNILKIDLLKIANGQTLLCDIGFQEFSAECLLRIWNAVNDLELSLGIREDVTEELRKFTEGFSYKPKDKRENNDKKFESQVRAPARSVGNKNGTSKKTAKKFRGKNGQKDQKNRKRDEKGRFLPKNA